MKTVTTYAVRFQVVRREHGDQGLTETEVSHREPLYCGLTAATAQAQVQMFTDHLNHHPEALCRVRHAERAERWNREKWRTMLDEIRRLRLETGRNFDELTIAGYAPMWLYWEHAPAPEDE